MNTNVEKLVNENQKLIYWGFNKYASKSKPQYEEEIMSIANYSLFKTAKNFNPDKNIKFSTLYAKVLCNEIGEFYRKQNAKIRKSEFGEDVSLSSAICDNEDIELERCISIKNPSPVHDIIIKDIVKEFINSLSEDEKRLVILKYNNPEITQRQLSKIIGVSQPVIWKRFNKIRQKYIKIYNK